jgi:hypothetical protein
MSGESFSFPSYRRLRRYLGETDAMVELTELAARAFVASAEQSGDIQAFVQRTSDSFNVRVNLPEVSQLLRHLHRHYIVTVYQSAECFLHEFRREHISLYRREWTGDGDDPLTVTLNNISSSEAEATNAVGVDIVSRFHYYRSVRNWVVHTKEADTSKPARKYAEIVPYAPENEAAFKALVAPNKPEQLTFDDFVCFTRITKKVAERLCSISKPANGHWHSTFDTAIKRFRRLSQNPERMRNSIAGRLRTEFGMDIATAQWIAEEIIKAT